MVGVLALVASAFIGYVLGSDPEAQSMAPNRCLAPGCDEVVEEFGGRYCRLCRCLWCGGDASGPEAIDMPGGHVCSQSCRKHYVQFTEVLSQVTEAS